MRKVANMEIYLFSATKQDRVGPSLQSRNTLFTSAACCTHCAVELDLKTREIPCGPASPPDFILLKLGICIMK